MLSLLYILSLLIYAPVFTTADLLYKGHLKFKGSLGFVLQHDLTAFRKYRQLDQMIDEHGNYKTSFDQNVKDYGRFEWPYLQLVNDIDNKNFAPPDFEPMPFIFNADDQMLIFVNETEDKSVVDAFVYTANIYHWNQLFFRPLSLLKGHYKFSPEELAQGDEELQQFRMKNNSVRENGTPYYSWYFTMTGNPYLLGGHGAKYLYKDSTYQFVTWCRDDDLTNSKIKFGNAVFYDHARYTDRLAEDTPVIDNMDMVFEIEEVVNETPIYKTKPLRQYGPLPSPMFGF